MSSRKCLKVRDIKFCSNASEKVCEACETYFKCLVWNLEKRRAPYVACSNLEKFKKVKNCY